MKTSELTDLVVLSERLVIGHKTIEINIGSGCCVVVLVEIESVDLEHADTQTPNVLHGNLNVADKRTDARNGACESEIPATMCVK